MPDPTNVTHIQEQKAQETHAAYKRAAVRHTLAVLDLAYTGAPLDYLTLVTRLRAVLDEELDTLTATPTAPPQSAC